MPLKKGTSDPEEKRQVMGRAWPGRAGICMAWTLAIIRMRRMFINPGNSAFVQAPCLMFVDERQM